MPFQITDLFVPSLSSENREFLIARLTSLPLLLRAALYKLEDTTSYIYFRTSAIASVVKSMADGGTAELGLIGQEGNERRLHLLWPAFRFDSLLHADRRDRRSVSKLRKVFRSRYAALVQIAL
jgi:hypothetical protein